MKIHEQIKNKKDMEKIRRQLRTNGTAAEAALWTILRRKQVAGIKFRRQFSIGPFVVDFYSPEINLVMELDGMVHYNPEAMEYDERRTEYIKGTIGATVLRFENRVVFESPKMVIEEIERVKDSISFSAKRVLP